MSNTKLLIDAPEHLRPWAVRNATQFERDHSDRKSGHRGGVAWTGATMGGDTCACFAYWTRARSISVRAHYTTKEQNQ